jgi:hypothetical protein
LLQTRFVKSLNGPRHQLRVVVIVGRKCTRVIPSHLCDDPRVKEGEEKKVLLLLAGC